MRPLLTMLHMGGPTARSLTRDGGSAGEENAEGSIEFTVRDVASADDFFPVAVSFTSKKTYAGISIDSVELADGGDVDFSSEVAFEVAAYEYI